MTYLKRSNPRERKGKRVAWAIVILLVALFSVQFFFPRAYPSIIYPLFAPLWKSETGVLGWISHKIALAGSKADLVVENENLSQELASRDAGALLLETLKAENEQLKNALGRSGRRADVLALVISRPPISPYDTLIVDAGAKSGIKVGDNVYADGDVIIGDVVEVYTNQSKVSLFSTPGRTTLGRIGTSSVDTLITGSGSGGFTARVPVSITPHVGDIAAMPLIKPHVFGVVGSVSIDSTDSLATVLLTLPVNMNSVRFVEIDTADSFIVPTSTPMIIIKKK
jgi:hypothetical protein